jgi:NADPH:quinone reductase-like Zn-dependent oxidoreductase
LYDVPKTMKGILLTGHGGIDKLLFCEDLPTPIPSSEEVLIRVSAAGVNNTDINTRLAWYSKGDHDAEDASWSGHSLNFPLIQGADVCGTIVQVGNLVDENRIGERVLIEPCIQEAHGKALSAPWYFGSECNGGFAEFTTVASRHAYKVDSMYTSAELASFPCSYSTAENMLTRSGVSRNDRVLITGASGGVGSAAVQLAKARGAYVIAITSENKAEGLINIGADEIILRNSNLLDALAKNSIDVVIDLVAGPSWPDLLSALRPGGRYAVSGAIGGPIVELDVRTLYLKDLRFFGCTVLEPKVFGNLVNSIEQKAVRPLVAKTYNLEDIVEAQNDFLSKEHIGKIVLTIEP